MEGLKRIKAISVSGTIGGIYVSWNCDKIEKEGDLIFFYNEREIVGAVDKSVIEHKLRVSFKGSNNPYLRYITYRIIN